MQRGAQLWKSRRIVQGPGVGSRLAEARRHRPAPPLLRPTSTTIAQVMIFTCGTLIVMPPSYCGPTVLDDDGP
jgi:hypothetical protein